MKLGSTLSVLLAFKFSFAVSMWMWWRASGVRRRGAPLSSEMQDRFAGYFRAETLGRVRVADGDPGLGGIGWLARKVGLGMIQPRAMTLGDEILVAPGASSESLMFHELVHVVQFGELGRRRFLERYLCDWFKTGSYHEIALEREAYALQARFERGEAFDVQDAVGAI